MYQKRGYARQYPARKTVSLAQANYMATKAATLAATKAVKAAAAPKKKRAVKVTPKARYAKTTTRSHRPHPHGHHGHTHDSHATARGRSILGSIGEAAGGFLPGGNITGQALGWLGDKISDGIGTLMGFGEYKVKQNSLMEEGGNVLPEGGRPPRIENAVDLPADATIVRHQEYLGDIVTSATAGAFKCDTYYINPGLITTFPWLSGSASQYQQYSLKGMIFEFRSMAADAISGTNIALGTVSTSTFYDSSSPVPTTKQDMQNSQYATSTKPSLSVLHPIECDPEVTTIDIPYIRTGALVNGEDQKLYDWGMFNIATSGFQGASVTIGELWVSYEVALIKPRADQLTGDRILAAHLQSNTSTNANPFLGFVNDADSTMSVSVADAGSSIVLARSSGLQVGQRFFVRCNWIGSGPVATVVGALTYTGLTAISAFNNATESFQHSPQAGATNVNSVSVCMIVEVNSVAQDPKITIAASTLPTGSGFDDLYVLQVPPQFE